MSNYYSNPTANMAIRAVEQELCLMRIKARHIKALKEKGRLTTEDLEQANKQFIGIYRPLLIKALADKPQKKTASRRRGKPACLHRISLLRLNLLISVAHENSYHVAHGGHVSVKLVLEGSGTGAAAQGSAPGICPDRSLHLPAVYILEDDRRQLIAVGREAFSGVVVNGLIGIPEGNIEFHVRDDVDCGRHFFLPGTGLDCRIQNQIKNCFQIGAAGPILTKHIIQLFRQILTMNLD